MFNSCLFLLHILINGCLVLFAFRFGKEVLMAFLSFLIIAMNLFTIKQIDLFGFHVTSSDALAVGYLLGLNLIQEVFGKKTAQQTFYISLFIGSSYLIISIIQLAYIPNIYDHTQNAFSKILLPSFRLFCASIFSFGIVQFFDLKIFAKLRETTKGRYLPLRIFLSLCFSELLDTALFTFLGLSGLVHSLLQIAYISLIIKGITIILYTPFTIIARRIISYEKI